MFPQNLTTFDEIGDPNDILKADNLLNFDYQELQAKYNILCKTYAEEIETSNKIKKSLGKCLKFYSKLCKKYEAQQITIDSLQKTIKQKMNCLEESLKNQEKMKGLIDVYKRERILYCAETNFNLQKDKEILLDVCCKLISESVKTNNIRNITNLILKKFKNDLDKEKINLLKEKQVLGKPKSEKLKNSDANSPDPEIKPNVLENNFATKDIRNLEENKNFKCDNLEKLDLNSCEIFKVESKETCETSTDDSSEEIKNVEKMNDYVKQNVFADEDETEKNNFKINETVPSILPLSSNLLSISENLDLGFLEKNSNCNSNERGNKVIPNAKSRVEYGNIEKNDKMNTNSEPGLPSLFFEQENEKPADVEFSNFPNFELNQNNAGSCEIEELSFESDYKKEKPFAEDSNIESNSEIVQKLYSNNVHENSTVKLNHITNEDDENKNALNSKLNDLNSIFDSSNSLVDFQRRSQELEKEKMDSKNEALLFSNEQGAAPAQKSTNDGAVLQNSTSLDNFLEITAEKRLSSDIYVQKGSDSLNCQTDVIGLFNSNELNLSSFSNSNSDSEGLSEELDGEKIVVNHTELSQIFSEMSTLRLLSPIREINKSHQVPSLNGVKTCKMLSETILQSSNQNSSLKPEKRKSADCDTSECKKSRVNKKKNCERQKKETSNGLLDSIMEAMSTQNAQFKSSANSKPEVPVTEQPLGPYFQVQNGEKNISQIPQTQNFEFSSSVGVIAKNDKEIEQQKVQFSNKIYQVRGKNENKSNFDNAATQKIQQFISSSISSKEEAEKNMADCLAALENTSATTIAKPIVGLVLANIDEKVEIFERPVPPLTRTQCRLVTLLSVLKAKNSKFEKIVDVILEEISAKLFPDNFFWPDDSVEMASRFYTALCKNRNDSENLWKFCLQAMTDMKQRSSVVVFTILKTWPDILHEEPTCKNNILTTTVANVILHTTLNNTLANGNQKKKLLALKHLLMNFYGFKVNSSIEEYGNVLLESFFKNESVAEKSLVLLIKCRDVVWTSKHIFPKLGNALKEWSQNNVDDDVLGHRILGVLRQTASIFSETKGNHQSEAQIFISYLSEALTFGKLSHESEQRVVDVLLCLKHYPEAKNRIRDWVPKGVVKEGLRNEIFNLSAENILRELKFNRRRDLLDNPNKSKKGKRKFGDKSKARKKGKNKKKKLTNKRCKRKLKNCKSQLNPQNSD